MCLLGNVQKLSQSFRHFFLQGFQDGISQVKMEEFQL